MDDFDVASEGREDIAYKEATKSLWSWWRLSSSFASKE